MLNYEKEILKVKINLYYNPNIIVYILINK